MAQNGVHGLVGLAAGRLAGGHGAFTFGLVLGSIAPDLDLIPTALVHLYDKHLAEQIHRSFTHSLVTAAVIGLAAAWLGRGSAPSEHAARVRGIGLGLALGIALHGLLDVVLWFSAVDLAWPLGLLGLPSRVNLWVGYESVGRLNNYLGAADYLAYALYLGALTLSSARCGTDETFRPAVRRWALIFSGLFLVYMILAVQISPERFTMLHYGPFSFAAVPLVIWLTIRMRRTIETAGQRPVEPLAGTRTTARA